MVLSICFSYHINKIYYIDITIGWLISIFNTLKFMLGGINPEIYDFGKYFRQIPLPGVKPFFINQFGFDKCLQFRKLNFIRVREYYPTKFFIVAAIPIKVIEFDVWHEAKIVRY